MPFHLNEDWSVSGRFRMDFRFLESLEDGEVSSGFDFVFRPRLQTVLTRRFAPIRFGQPFVSLAHEVLFNAYASPERDALDQNRVSLLFGLETKYVTLRLGYMNRYLPTARGGDGRIEHAAILWFTQSVDLTRRSRTSQDPDEDFPEYGGP